MWRRCVLYFYYNQILRGLWRRCVLYFYYNQILRGLWRCVLYFYYNQILRGLWWRCVLYFYYNQILRGLWRRCVLYFNAYYAHPIMVILLTFWCTLKFNEICKTKKSITFVFCFQWWQTIKFLDMRSLGILYE